MTWKMSAEGRRVLDGFYDAAVERLPFEVRCRRIDTPHGVAQVLEAGPEDGLPLLVPHGMNAFAPLTLALCAPLAERFRLVAPDLPGQAGRSEGGPLPFSDNSVGTWLAAVADGLGLDRYALIGASQGAFVSLRAAAVAPERVTHLVLAVPSGLHPGNLGFLLFRFLFPALFWWRILGNRARFRRVIQQMFTDPIDDDWLDLIAACMQYLPTARERWPMATREEYAGLRAPVLVIPAENDPTFPPHLVLPAVDAAFPDAQVSVLEGECHFPSVAGQKVLMERIAAFLDAHPSAP